MSVGEIAGIVAGGTPSTSVPEYWDGGIPWCTPTDVTGSRGMLLTRTARSISEAGLAASSANLLPAGSLLLCTRATIGDVRIAAQPTATNQGFKSLIVHQPNSSIFFYFLISSLKDRLIERSSGSTFLELSKRDLERFVLLVPPPAEQREIAEALTDAASLVESLDALIAKKRDIKQAAIQQLLTGQTRLGGAGTSWKIQKIGDLFSFKRITALSRAQLSDDGPCGYIHYGDIHSRWGTHLDLSQEVLPRCSHELAGSASYLEEGDLIMADASEDLEGVGRMVEVRNIGAQKVISGLHTVLLRPAMGIFAPGFAGFVSLMPDFVVQARTLAAGLKVYVLSKSALASIGVSVPDTQEQQLISAVLLDMDAEIDALVAQREKAELVKQGMMQELLSGRVRLT